MHLQILRHVILFDQPVKIYYNQILVFDLGKNSAS